MAERRQRRGAREPGTRLGRARLLGRRLPGGLPGLLVALLGLALVVAMIVVPSSPAAEVRLNDGSILVTNSSRALVGRLNHEIDRFASAVPMVNRSFDVLQDGRSALSRDNSSNQLQAIDAAASTLGAPMLLPANAAVALGAGTVAVVNPTNGRMWSRPIDAIFAVDTVKTPSDVDLGPGGTATVTTSGQPVGLSVQRRQLLRPAAGEQQGRTSEERTANASTVDVPLAMNVGDAVSISAVGDRAVVLNQATGQVWVEGSNPVQLPEGQDGQLAGPVAADERVQATENGVIDRTRSVDAVVSTPAGLFGVAGSRLLTLSDQATGTPVRPVVAGGCANGVFVSDTARVVRSCSGRTPSVQELPRYAPGAPLVLRRNRGIAVVNDTRSGMVWMLDKDLRLITDWDQVVPPKPTDGKAPQQDKDHLVPPNRNAQNRPPRAVDDTVAARAGRTTVLPLLDNDSDPDGDILTVVEAPRLASGNLSLVRGGTGIQVTLPADAPRQLSFSYTISDGRGGKATARANLEVLPGDPAQSNRPPVLRTGHDKPIDVPLSGREERRVLLDWVDPDGDDLILVKATAPGDDEVTFTPDGTLTYTDVGTAPGRKEIQLEISDGVSSSVGTLVVNARKAGDVPPVANGDFISAVAGQETVIRPMLNDTGDNLVLSAVDQVSGARVSPDFSAGSVTFSAEAPGTYYVGYTISNGPRATGLIRVDVAAPATANRPPVAARDVALLPAGGTVDIDPLANDEDPDHDVLALQSVESHPGLTVQLKQRRGLTITADNTPSGPLTLAYTVSDGHNQVTGTLVVVPAPAVADTRPVAVADEAVVRAGNQVSVPVLENDHSPSGLKLRLDKNLAEQPTPAVAWTDDENVRFIAPKVPGEYRAVYRITDAQGQEASAQVRFLVIAGDVENTPPEPRKVEGRVLAGTSGKVLIPLQGIDPQGDPVRLIGLDSGPRLGRVVNVTERWLEYEAYPDAAGTDTFGYSVTDARGARAVGEVRVGVIPRGATNTGPTAVDDTVHAKPGRRVKVPVLNNDTDPDGDRFGFAAKALDLPREMDAALTNDTVELTVPQQPGVTQGQYTVVDVRGAEKSAAIVVDSDPQAPPAPPVARDDIVAADAVAREPQIAVPVLANDFDPDGDLRLARLELPDAGQLPENLRPWVDGDRIQVKVGPTMQQIRYRLVDSDGLAAFGVITVPGRADSVPARLPGVPDPVVSAGESIDLDLAKFVVGTGGRDVTLTTSDRIWGTRGETSALSLQTVKFTANAGSSGPGSVSFEVTDGRNSSDPEGRRAVITLPVTVLPPANKKPEEDQRLNQPPRAEPITLTVGAGEEPRTLDLRQLITDPEGDDVTFSKPAGDSPTGIKVAVDQTRVTAQAELTTRPGTTAVLNAEARDAHGGVSPVQITVVVASSARPRARTLDDVVPDARQGVQSKVPVLRNDSNPFADRGPLKLVRAVVESGRGEAAVADDQVTVTPAADFVGTMVVRYQVEDATTDPDRRVEGRVRLTVRGVPGRPGVPRTSEVGDQRAVLTWTAPPANGADITSYEVQGKGSDGRQVTKSCETTTCTVGGLTNDVGVTFTVTAVNEVGRSQPSGSSAEVRPDVHPDQPGTPEVRLGDKKLTVSWPPAKSRGSAVTRYQVQLSGPGGTQLREVPGNRTELTWEGLTNGQAYRFRVQAANKAPTPSEWSGYSRPETPAGPPSPPRAVTASDSGGAFGKQVTVAWQRPASTNGAEITGYSVLANGQRIADVDGGATNKQVTVDNGRSYTFTVVAKNRAGDSPPSAASEPFTPFGSPGRAQAPQIRPGDNQVIVAPLRADANGSQITGWKIRIGDKEVTKNAAEAGREFSVPAVNGRDTTIVAIACAQNKCSDQWSPPSNKVKPFGPPTAPQVAAIPGRGAIKFGWNFTGTENGRGLTRRQARVDGGPWQDVQPTGELSPQYPPGSKHTLEARASNEAGDGAIARAEATAK